MYGLATVMPQAGPTGAAVGRDVAWIFLPFSIALRRFHDYFHLRRSALAALATLALAACTYSATNLPAIDPSDEAACALDGMLLRDFPGPKAQVRFADGKTSYFCDVKELLGEMLAPEQRRATSAFYVQDMGSTNWQQPQGHWIGAHDALYVLGSKAQGSMGPPSPRSAAGGRGSVCSQGRRPRAALQADHAALLNEASGAMPTYAMAH